MPTLELPHTAGCFVCGRDNHHGLQLSLHVDPSNGSIQTTFAPGPQHIGFQGIIHGGVLATAIDEAMVWSAIWSSRRSCVAGEITVRFRQKASVDQPLTVRAKATRVRTRMVETECEVTTTDGQAIATATGKYVPLSMEETDAFLETLIDEPATKAAAAMLGLPPSEPVAQIQSLDEPPPLPVLEYATGYPIAASVAIARFSDEFHAALAATCLEAEGIETTTEGQSTMIGLPEAIRLQVRQEDVSRAIEILKQTPARKFLYLLSG